VAESSTSMIVLMVCLFSKRLFCVLEVVFALHRKNAKRH